MLNLHTLPVLLRLTGVEVTGGDVTVNISWAGMQVATQTQDLCKFLSCPIKAGPITATYQNTMPSFVPRVRGL
jgi:hypothetical protein